MNETNPGAQHVVSRLMRESLMDKKLIAGTESAVRAILPRLNVVQIGGLSINSDGASTECESDANGQTCVSELENFTFTLEGVVIISADTMKAQSNSSNTNGTRLVRLIR